MSDDDLRAYVERDPNCRRGWKWRIVGAPPHGSPAYVHNTPYRAGSTETRWGARRKAHRMLAAWRAYMAGDFDPQREEVR